ncbi:MMPL family transporter [Pseudarthrobacter sp. NPDC058329]|uniref:MMPL family transporter n=1 Tax=Pseudarthrobacter sp. NPDC058329 TaxID=3346448 RepID=UPI0036DD347D
MARFLYKLGIYSARHRLLVVLSWATILVTAGLVALTGMRFSDGAFEIPGTESSKALTELEREFPVVNSDGDGILQLVLRTEDGQPITNEPFASNIATLTESATSLSHVSSVRSPFDPAQPYVSPDRTTAVLTLNFSGISKENAEEVYAEAETFVETVRNSGLEAELGGTLGNPVPEILGPTEIIGALMAFAVLFITFGSLVAAGANMLTALLGVGVGILGVFASSAFLQPVGSVTPILAVMLGLAVGIDYSLFILARFRAELRQGKDLETAVGRAIGTAGSSVVFAGTTVIIALAALAIVRIPFITEMGLAAAFSVFVAVAMALTLLPVLMRTMGTKVLPRREQQHIGEASTDTARHSDITKITFLEKTASFVVDAPVRSLIAAIGALVFLAIPVLSLQTTLNTPGGVDPDTSQRRAYNIISEEFGAGTQSPLIVLVQDDTNLVADAAEVSKLLTSMNGVDMVTPAHASASGTSALISVIPEGGPTDDSTHALVQDIRDRSGHIDAEVSVTGETAVSIDVDAQLNEALVLYIAVIVGLSLVLLVVLFRSVLIPLIATLGFLLSLGAGIGVTVAVFQWSWADLLFSAPTGSPLLSLLPILIVGILFGLAMDYQVFLVSGMREAYTKGYSPREAILDGFSKSAFIVVAAATIMAAVFGGFALSPSPLVASIALALTVGVIADAFIVRMIITPAAMSLLGRAAWWIPGWLEKVLPTIDTEGHGLDRLKDQPRAAERSSELVS